MPYADPALRRTKMAEASKRYNERKRQERLARLEAERASYVSPPVMVCAWAAGLVEGEGTITLNVASRTGLTRPTVQMSNTDADLVLEMDRWWPGIITIVRPGGKAKPAALWRVYSMEGVRRILLDLSPFFVSKRTKALANLVMQDLELRANSRSRNRRDPEFRLEGLIRAARVRTLNHRGTETFDSRAWLIEACGRYLHPDVGGDDSDAFLRLQRAVKVLDENDG